MVHFDDTDLMDWFDY